MATVNCMSLCKAKAHINTKDRLNQWGLGIAEGVAKLAPVSLCKGGYHCLLAPGGVSEPALHPSLLSPAMLLLPEQMSPVYSCLFAYTYTWLGSGGEQALPLCGANSIHSACLAYKTPPL